MRGRTSLDRAGQVGVDVRGRGDARVTEAPGHDGKVVAGLECTSARGVPVRSGAVGSGWGNTEVGAYHWCLLDVLPQLVRNRGVDGLRQAIRHPERFAIEPKVAGVRGLLAFLPDGTTEKGNRSRIHRDRLRGDGFEVGLRRLAQLLPVLWDGTVLDGELIASRFAGTMAALHGSRRRRDALPFVVFDVPFLAGVDLRPLSWHDRRERLELLAQAFEAALRTVARRAARPVTLRVSPGASIDSRWRPPS
jgi:hypothetical protein